MPSIRDAVVSEIGSFVGFDVGSMDGSEEGSDVGSAVGYNKMHNVNSTNYRVDPSIAFADNWIHKYVQY